MASTIRSRNNFAGLSRRKLLACVPAFALSSLAKGQNPPIQINKLNCFEIRVSDVARSVSFYQDLFGLAIQTINGDRVCLRIADGPSFMAIRPIELGESPAITNLGYSQDNYDIDSQLNILKSQGFSQIPPPSKTKPGIDNKMKTWIRLRGDTPELYFADERGLIVQLSDNSYCGGTGPLGNICNINENVKPGAFELSDINHFTVFVNDGSGNEFYQNLFGLAVQSYQGPGSPVVGIGDGYQFVMYPGPFPGSEGAPANIHHGCFNMRSFNEEQIISTLNEHGLTARGDNTIGPLMHYISRRMPARGGAEGGTPEVYFTDPDGILMQLQDESYCGGGGYLGNECIQV